MLSPPKPSHFAPTLPFFFSAMLSSLHFCGRDMLFSVFRLLRDACLIAWICSEFGWRTFFRRLVSSLGRGAVFHEIVHSFLISFWFVANPLNSYSSSSYVLIRCVSKGWIGYPPNNHESLFLSTFWSIIRLWFCYALLWYRWLIP